MTSDFDSSFNSKRRDQRQAEGKALRDRVPRSIHAEWKLRENRAEVLQLLEESNQDRLPDLTSMRFSRMLQSPFAFYRGSAIVMAADLASMPTTNIRLQICGDCHLQNFGWFATPERNLIFDLNDFDETCIAPWEWDLKRLVVSVVLAARASNATKSQQQELGQATAREYRELLTEYEALSPLEMWYVRLDADNLLDHCTEIATKKRTQQIIDAARRRTVDKMLPKMTTVVDGHLKFKDNPPLIFHPPEGNPFPQEIGKLMHQYRGTLSDERCLLLDRYRFADFAYKVVGVGSVGLRCGIILMLDADDAPLLLQVKEARASVLQKYVGDNKHSHFGRRIVHGQRVMQAASDMFLGWTDDSSRRSYYIRQLRDMKLSPNVAEMPPEELEEFAKLCAWTLARAHAKSGDVSPITGYLGTGSTFDEAMSAFGIAYSLQAENDFEVFQKAAKSGRIDVSSGG